MIFAAAIIYNFALFRETERSEFTGAGRLKLISALRCFTKTRVPSGVMIYGERGVTVSGFTQPHTAALSNLRRGQGEKQVVQETSLHRSSCDKGVWDPVSLPLPRHARKLLSCHFFLVLSFSFLSFHVHVKETNQVGMF